MGAAESVQRGGESAADGVQLVGEAAEAVMSGLCILVLIMVMRQIHRIYCSCVMGTCRRGSASRPESMQSKATQGNSRKIFLRVYLAPQLELKNHAWCFGQMTGGFSTLI